MLDPSIIKDGFITLGERAASGDTDLSWIDYCDVIGDYANSLDFPKPIGVSAGVSSMKGVLASISHNNGEMAPIMLSQGLMLLVTSIMASYPLPVGPSATMGSGTFPTMPPSTPLNLNSVLSRPNELKSFASIMATTIDGWFRTGLVDIGVLTPGAPPVPVPIPTPWH